MGSWTRWIAALAAISLSCGDDDAPVDAGAGSDASVDSGQDASSDGEMDAGSPITEARFDPLSDGFWAQPFPLESRRNDGIPEVTDFPNPRNVGPIEKLIDMVQAQSSGFAADGPIWIPFTGPIDASNYPTDPAAYTSMSAPVLLVNVDPDSDTRGALTPVWVSVSESGDPYRAEHMLQVVPVPGMNLPEDTLHAIIVRDLRDGNGNEVGASDELLRRLNETDELGALGDWLSEEDIELSTIDGATMFRTDVSTDRLRNAAQWARSQPSESASAASLLLADEAFCAFQTTWSVPQYQNGEPPFDGSGGDLVLDASGSPQEQRREDAPIVVVFPTGEMPSSGWPLVIWVNGTGGTSREMLDRAAPSEPTEGHGIASYFAARGWAAAAMAGPLTEERIGPGNPATRIYNLANPVAMRDNLAQMVIEQVLLRRLLLELRVDPATCPGADASAATDGMLAFDADHLAIMGNSLGSYVAGITATVDPGLDAVLLGGAGGSWGELVFGVRDPNLEALIRLVMGLRPAEPMDRWHPALGIFQWALGPAENTHYVDELLRHSPSSFDSPHVLVVDGLDDDQISAGMQRALVAALGVDLAGEDVGPTEEQVLPAIELSGREALDFPVSMNVDTAAGSRTAAIVRWEPTRDDAGHYVHFELPGARHQIGCFLETLRDGAPVVVEGTTADGPCN